MIAIVLAWIAVAGWCYLAFAHGRFWEPLLPEAATRAPAVWPSVDIIVPARNEADSLPHSLPSLLKQDYPGRWRVILVDDHSTDGTSDVAANLTEATSGNLMILSAPDLPPGWSGKVAAMNAGVQYSRADYVLFTDADIKHPSHSLTQLVARAMRDRLDLTSLMVMLRCQSFAEKLLIPAFVFFFAMLYPFRSANDSQLSLAAAAGGVMLVKRHALENIGGLARIKSALIDDCSLAAAIKKNGGEKQSAGRISLTLTQDVHSLRPYPEIKDIWNMVARTAYTQLKYSPLLLTGTIIGMAILYLIPLLMIIFGHGVFSVTGFAVWALMSVLYLPTVLFYRLMPFWAVTLPLAAGIYMAATIDSAHRYHRGQGGQWKGRSQA